VQIKKIDEDGYRYYEVGKVNREGDVYYPDKYVIKECSSDRTDKDCIYLGFKPPCDKCIQLSYGDSIRDYYTLKEEKQESVKRFEFSKKAVS